jgi:hypothetical protein
MSDFHSRRNVRLAGVWPLTVQNAEFLGISLIPLRFGDN